MVPGMERVVPGGRGQHSDSPTSSGGFTQSEIFDAKDISDESEPNFLGRVQFLAPLHLQRENAQVSCIDRDTAHIEYDNHLR